MRRMMKHILVMGAFAFATGGQSLSADLNYSPHPPPPYPSPLPPVPLWTGFYFGGNLGAGWSQGSVSDTAGITFTPNSNVNFLGGGQVGYNYQFGVGSGVVVGAEADFDWAGNHNNTNAAAGVTVTTNDRWLTTLTGRLGYAPWEHLLFYGKGGGAWVGSSDPTITNVTTGASITPSTSNSNFGWTLGAGVDGRSGQIGQRGSSTILSG